MKLVLTCEHASNEIPEEYKYLFQDAMDILKSHRGYDPGALDLFKELRELADFSSTYKISRLLIEVNRSIGHPDLFSEYTKELSSAEKKRLIKTYYIQYRNEVEVQIKRQIESGEKVLHLSVHSFMPVLNGEIRNADIGLLYDPSRKDEKLFCKELKSNLSLEDPSLKIRYNYPYLGKADGFTTYLRRKFPKQYSGVELEINQKFVKDNRMDGKLKNAVFKALQKTFN